ncbi:MAG TPA: GNAT family N-acetyltransferase [Candidatus Limnocylindrales bacterium]|nr:GNAT family N-acetyltransferase [Candidatus Limnocylindrales bacterium]
MRRARTLAAACVRRCRPLARVEEYGFDRDLFADLMTGYYLSREPARAWVAVSGERLVGYVFGTTDTRHRRRSTALLIAPAALGRFLLRGSFLRRAPWRSLLVNWPLLRRHGSPPAGLLERHPAHLHIAVAESHRSVGLGAELLSRFLEGLRAAGVAGVHAAVRSDYPGGRRFFERQGFRACSCGPAPRHPDADGDAPERILYAREL